ncbi:hypothetical protein [Psychromicrobium sp. YIM B11713]|uniref:hypothetical protein n=1 Tax=Psychromicrobium sp. YIM B11713 TaxID=3145233 RepID=UPI00374F814D
MDDAQDSQQLDLQSYRSFFLGSRPLAIDGEQPEQHVLAAAGVPVTINPNGTYRTGGMYVQEFRQRKPRSKEPVLFMHGGSMSGAVWEHTPDGRDGWLQHFLRAGFHCYNADAVERGRSGWNPRDPHFQERPILRTAEDAFQQFRLGLPVEDAQPATLEQAAYPGLRFPLHYFQRFAEGLVPRWTGTDEIVLSAYRELIELIGPVTLCAHSQGAAFAFQLAEQQPELITSIIALEPAQAGLGDGSAMRSTKVLAIYGDYLDRDNRWPIIRGKTDAYFAQSGDHGAEVTIVDLPQAEIFGNSHLLLVENNNAEIAQLAINWLNEK